MGIVPRGSSHQEACQYSNFCVFLIFMCVCTWLCLVLLAAGGSFPVARELLVAACGIQLLTGGRPWDSWSQLVGSSCSPGVGPGPCIGTVEF